MSWILTEDFFATPLHRELKAFLTAEEYSCIDITSLLAAPDYNDKKGEYTLLVHVRDNGSPDAVIFITAFGKMIPVFADDFLYRRRYTEELLRLAGERLETVTVISGKPRAVETAAREFNPMGNRIFIDYYIMQLRKENLVRPAAAENTRAHKGSLVHLPFLMPLQKEYEMEEVLLNPDYFDQMESIRWLKAILTREICFYSMTGLKYTSKANTNARGFCHFQIGGVFTHRDFRGRGIGKNTVHALCSHIFSHHDMHVSLFVKQDNASAIKAYTDLGFRNMNRMRTIYYY